MSGDRLVAADVAARSVRPSPTANRVGLSGTSVEKIRDVGAGVGAWVSCCLPAWRVFGSRSMGGRRRRSPGSGDVAGVAARDRLGLDRGARDDHRGVLRRRLFAAGGLGAASAGGWAAEAGVRIGSVVRCAGGARVRAGVHGPPVPTGRRIAGAAGGRGVASGGRWAGAARGPTHQVLMRVLAAQSQREVVRSRHRTVAAMRVQAVEEGRYLGGRPPYGYRLIDAGPHPNQFGLRG